MHLWEPLLAAHVYDHTEPLYARGSLQGRLPLKAAAGGALAAQFSALARRQKHRRNLSDSPSSKSPRQETALACDLDSSATYRSQLGLEITGISLLGLSSRLSVMQVKRFGRNSRALADLALFADMAHKHMTD
jgi:hypothetical protein